MTSKKHAAKQNSTQEKLAPEWEAALKSVMRSEPDFIVASGKNGVVTHHLQQQ